MHLEHIGETANFLEQLAVGEARIVIGMVAFPVGEVHIVVKEKKKEKHRVNIIERFNLRQAGQVNRNNFFPIR